MLGTRPALLVALAAALTCVNAFYLPGAAPRNYAKGDRVDLFVNALTPLENKESAKLRSLLNYDYYDERFHFCKPPGGEQKQGESLGSILFGDRIFNSPYNVSIMQQNHTCQKLCSVSIPPEDSKFINDRIQEDYALNWLVDGLPAAEMKEDVQTGELFFDMGFDLGKDEGEFAEHPALNNHYEIVLKYHKPTPDQYRIVGVLVWPRSHGGSQTGKLDCEDSKTPLQLDETKTNEVRYTYRITWQESDTPWATRWDNYLHNRDGHNRRFEADSSTRFKSRFSFIRNDSRSKDGLLIWEQGESRLNRRSNRPPHRHPNRLESPIVTVPIVDPRIHWFSLINSIAIVVILCVMVSTILLRSVSRDIHRYNALDMEEVQEDYGWKLIHGEVFRTPQAPLLLSVLVGNGAQLCAMVAVTLVFALLGFLSPSNRGSLATVMMVCWTFFGCIGGYVSSRVYASLGGTDKKKNSFLTATALPTLIFAMVFLLNLFLISAGSSGAVPFGTMLVIILLWFVISAPLSAVGSYFGSRHGGISHPVRVNQIPRQIPKVPSYLKPATMSLLAGILPFGAAFIELYYVLSSLFASRAYYAFGFVSLTATVFGLTTAMVSILFTYFLLCAEEYRWHWRAFLAGGGSAVWLLMYGVYYWLSRLSLDSVSSVALYFGYLLLLALLDFLVTGTIGFLATYFAVRKLYQSIRID